MRKIIGFRTLCVGLGIWVGTVGVSAQGEFKALPWSQSTAYNSYLMRDVHRQFADRQSAIQQAFASPAGMQEYLEGCRERYKQIVGTFPEKGNLNAQVVGKVQGTGYHIEKIIFESKPGRYVTAHLYMPENTEPITRNTKIRRMFKPSDMASTLGERHVKLGCAGWAVRNSARGRAFLSLPRTTCRPVFPMRCSPSTMPYAFQRWTALLVQRGCFSRLWPRIRQIPRRWRYCGSHAQKLSTSTLPESS